MLKYIWQRPAVVFVISFMIIILTGTLLLKLPASHVGELSWIDALFTATSATCVTGLIVKDTPVDFTRIGQIIILFMIQLGGLGLMTFSMAFAVLLGKKLNFTSKTFINKMIDYDRPGYTVFFLKKVITVVIILELIGSIFMIIAFNVNNISDDLFFHSVFHSISAFCNAGFSTFSDSLMQFKSSILVNIIIMSLIVTGGIGFFVLIEIYSILKKKFILKESIRRLSVQGKIVVFSTVILILMGTLFFYVLEYNNILKAESSGVKIIVSFFQSITTRTAGFNSVDISKLSRATLLIFIGLMFIGAGPGGTAGGIKITTVYIFLKSVIRNIKNRKDVFVFGRKIPEEIVDKATAVFFVSIFINFIGIFILCITETFELKDIAFEVISAFGTVGLSTGITPHLSSVGKITILMLMFIGRLGPITLAVAISKQHPVSYYSLPEEKVMIG